MFLQAVTAKAVDAPTPSGVAQQRLARLPEGRRPPKASAAAAAPALRPRPCRPRRRRPARRRRGGRRPERRRATPPRWPPPRPDAYPGDNAPREQIAAWMAGQAQKRGLPPQLPLMASLVESGMKNLNFGDADSVGFFQMRVGIWNQGAYAGYPDKPELQVKWFLDQAEAVKRQRLVAGKSITDPNQFGDWIADVERPAEQYRGRYQTKLGEANSLLSVGARATRRGARRRGGGRAGRSRRRRGGRGRARRRQAAGRGPRPGRAGDRGRQGARPEGAGGDPGSVEVHRHRLQVGRLDAADGLRLLGADAVGLRAVRGPDPARHLHADRGRQRRRDRRPGAPEAGRPRVLRQRRRRPPRRHVPRRRQVPARAAHRRRGEGLEPERAVLRVAVRGRTALRRRRRRRRRAGRAPAAGAAPVAAAAAVAPADPQRRRPPRPPLRSPPQLPRRASTRPRSPRPRPPSPATPPRCAATTRSSSRRSRPSSPPRSARRASR